MKTKMKAKTKKKVMIMTNLAQSPPARSLGYPWISTAWSCNPSLPPRYKIIRNQNEFGKRHISQCIEYLNQISVDSTA